MHRSPRTLGYITPTRACAYAGEIYTHVASGRILDALAKVYEKVYVCARVSDSAPPSPDDLPLEAANIEVIKQPYWGSSIEALPHFLGIARAYIRTCRKSDILFVRGMCPYIAILYLAAFLYRRPICHWIVGDPVTLLRESRRSGRLYNSLALTYAIQDRIFSRIGRWLTHGAFICNGRKLASAYRSPRTIAAVSSTVRESEFFVRADTCQGKILRILFVGYIRPEKGIEHLLGAVSKLDSRISWELEIVGPAEFPEYRERLDRIVNALGISRRVKWAGYLSFGPPIFRRMRASDIFVLPTLSEGTPHVLVEARANSLPCVSTNVGGVPSTVEHEKDALLVPPKDSAALARAIERIAREGELRRELIRNGFESARRQTLERFVAEVRRELQPDIEAVKQPVPQQ